MACFFIVDTYIDKNKGRGSYDACFASDEYRRIMHERVDSVDARAVIIEDAANE